MLGVPAEFETNLHRERQLEGITAAKEQGIYKRCKSGTDANEVRSGHPRKLTLSHTA